eukprot:1187261-Rhodomonas_salina.1
MGSERRRQHVKRRERAGWEGSKGGAEGSPAEEGLCGDPEGVLQPDVPPRTPAGVCPLLSLLSLPPSLPPSLPSCLPCPSLVSQGVPPRTPAAVCLFSLPSCLCPLPSSVCPSVRLSSPLSLLSLLASPPPLFSRVCASNSC